MVTTLCFHLYPIPVFLRHWLPAAIHSWFTRFCTWRPNESMKQNISSFHMLLVSIHSSFSFITLLFKPRLSEHEQSGAIGMLKAGVRVSDVVRYLYCHPSFIQRLKDRYQASGTLKDRRRSGQPEMATGVKRQLTSIVYRRYLHRRYPFQPATVSARRIVELQG